MTTKYRSDELFAEICERHPYVDQKQLKTATENELMAMSGRIQDDIFIQYGIARRWDEAEKKKRRSEYLARKFG